jgi:anti-anti-sigma factor
MTSPVRPPFEITVNGHVTVVKFTEPILDERNLRPAAEALDAIAERPGQEEVRLDFGGVNFLSSFGLGKVISLHKRLQPSGRRLVLVNVPPLLYDVFRVSGLLNILDLRTEDGSSAKQEKRSSASPGYGDGSCSVRGPS